MSLNLFQSTFTDVMLRPQKDIEEQSDTLRNFITKNEIPLSERLKIYHNNIVGSLTEILRGCYPLCENLIGEDAFKALCRSYIFKNPPSSGCMIFYGRDLNIFIKTYKPTEQIQYLSDIATLEWALHHAYHAQDEQPLSAETLSNIPPDLLAETSLTLSDSVTLITSAYPLIKIREFCLSKSEDKILDITSYEPNHVLINRGADLDIQITQLKSCEHQALRNIENKKPLGECLEDVMTDHPEFDFSAFLQRHLSLETFTDIVSNKKYNTNKKDDKT